jgi:hypothetical protein
MVGSSVGLGVSVGSTMGVAVGDPEGVGSSVALELGPAVGVKLGPPEGVAVGPGCPGLLSRKKITAPTSTISRNARVAARSCAERLLIGSWA